MLKECFETGMPIRIVNKNKFYVYAYNYALIINGVLLLVLNNFFQFIGPAIAYIISDSFVYLYLGIKVLKIYQIKLVDLFYWKKIFYIFLSSFLLVPLLFIGECFKINDFIKIPIFSILYFIFYFLILINIDIEEFQVVYKKILIKTLNFRCKVKIFLKMEAV